jgi:hypothetical protein
MQKIGALQKMIAAQETETTILKSAGELIGELKEAFNNLK